jgi:ubiquinone/menaquinone biosynthesis C-methylase UbiE/uncharacterized protein YbaR (Trm112 family)
MSTNDQKGIDTKVYVCPKCKGRVMEREEGLFCSACQIVYPFRNGFPDFILEDLTQSSSPILRGIRSIDKLAGIYETNLWYPLVLTLYGGFGKTSLTKLLKIVSGILETTTGRILDAACGPGTFGRRIASPSKEVYGIDVSLGMLRRGAAYIQDEGISNVHFARSKVEALPFEDAFFNGAICCGSLHLFIDTIKALREINRTLVDGSPLAVFTFIGGDSGILKFRRIREHLQQDHGAHIFEISKLEEYLTESGFTAYQPKVHGSVLTFSAIKYQNPESGSRDL